MACGDFATYKGYWYAGQFFDAVYCVFGDQLGGLLFGVLVFGAIGISLYVSSGSSTVPLTLAVILASVVFVEVPASAVQIAAIAVILGIGIAGYLMIVRLEGR